MEKFDELGLKTDLVAALAAAGVTKPTDVQEQTIPIALLGRDMIVRAKTGTGKTYAFVLPIVTMMEKANTVRALIIAPTRELALQINENIAKLRQHDVRSVVAYGGVSINEQIRKIQRGCNILVGTPGRLLDLLERGALRLDSLQFFVLDEADTMLDMGFIEDIEDIMAHTPNSKQSLFLSATIPESLFRIAREHMHDPQFLSVGEEENLIVAGIAHTYSVVQRNQKFQALLAYLNEYKPQKVIIFVHTKFGSELVHGALQQVGFKSILMHGGLTQAKREISLDRFKTGATILVTTNVTARGIDIKDITDVINYDVPLTPLLYLHRVGRSARMGKGGRAFTIVTDQERRLIEDVEFENKLKMLHLDLNLANYEAQAREAFSHIRQHRDYGDRGGGRGRGDRRPRFGGNRSGGFGERRGGYGDRSGRGGQDRGSSQRRGPSRGGDFRRRREFRPGGQS